MPIKWMALECIHYRKFTHQSDVWSYGECISCRRQCFSCSSDLKSCLVYLHLHFHPLPVPCHSLGPFVSPFQSFSVYLINIFVFLLLFRTTHSRSDHLGADDIRRQALRWDPHARNPRHPGKRRAPAPAANLHHRRLHGHGQM